MKAKECRYESVANYLKNGQCAEAIAMMTLWNNEQLGLFLLNHMSLRVKWVAADFDEFWKQRLSQLLIQSKPDFRFMAQPNVLNADLVTGYLLFLIELRTRAQHKFVEEKNFGVSFFHLTRKHLHDVYLEMPQFKSPDLERLNQVLYNLEFFAKQQGCPGYLLLANGYMQLALGYQRLKNAEYCESSFKLCWKYLHLAALSERDSGESINNAYFGEGIVLSTPFQLESIAELKNYCREAAGAVLTLRGQAEAEQTAEHVYRKLIGIGARNKSCV